MGSKFAIKGGAQPTPRICKAVGDSFRFVSVPFKTQMSVFVDQKMELISFGFDLVGYGTAQQQGNPLQIWNARIGEVPGQHIDVRLTYDDIVNILSILYLAFNGLSLILTRTATIHDIDLKSPFKTDLIKLPPAPIGGHVLIQILY